MLYELQHSLECRRDKGRTCVEKSVCISTLIIFAGALQNNAKRNSLIISFTCVRSWWEEEASDVFTSQALQVKQVNDYHVGHVDNNLVNHVEHHVVADGSKVITITTLQGDPDHGVGGEWRCRHTSQTKDVTYVFILELTAIAEVKDLSSVRSQHREQVHEVKLALKLARLQLFCGHSFIW